MVLSGSLHEFILADVFQLLAQQKATGKLVVAGEKNTGFVIMLEGELVAAQEGDESLETRLVNCLTTIKGLAKKDVGKLLSGTGNKLSAFASATVQKKHLTGGEVAGLARTTVEDITCDLFAWTRGTYRFESLDKISDYLVNGVRISSDSVIMEAMRRIDEMKRQQFRIPMNTVYVRIQEDAPADFDRDLSEILVSPDDYLLSFINGMLPLASLTELTCLGEYIVIETVARLAAEHRIAPLSARVSRSIQAAMNRDPRFSFAHMLGLAGSVAACILIMLAALFYRIALNYRFPASDFSTLNTQTDQSTVQSKRETAQLLYWAQIGRPPQSDADLFESKILYIRDLYQPATHLRP